MNEYPQSTLKENSVPMDEDGAHLFALCLSKEWCGDDSPLSPEDMPLGSQIINARIVGMTLPIKFTTAALVAAGALGINPGKAVVVLCDCLSAYENQTVSVKKLAELYPWGFYNDEVFRSIVDDWMKTGKHKWAHVYNVLG
jgi:hypothetical protein